MSRELVSDIVRRLQDPDLSVRLKAVEDLDELPPYGRLMQIGMPPDEGLAVMRAACAPWPRPDEERQSIPQRLMLALCSVPHPSYLPLLLEHYPRFEGDETKWQALMLLSHMPQREAAESWVRWYRERWASGRGTPPPFSDWARLGLHADVVLPALLEFADTDDAWLSERLYDEVLRYVRGGENSAAVRDQLVSAYRALVPGLKRAQRKTGVGWRYEGDYLFERFRAAKLLELFGHFARGQVEPLLREALTYADPLLRSAAAIALLRLASTVDRAEIEALAADPEVREKLYRALRRLKKARLFPRRFATQRAIAEADMVQWLIADIDAGPEEIELLEPVERGGARYYVFRFRYAAPHDAAKDGWLAGISGPWADEGRERADACGGTFSEFEPAERRSPSEHVRHLISRTRLHR